MLTFSLTDGRNPEQIQNASALNFISGQFRL